MQVQEFFDPETFTLTYVVFDEASADAVIIDPVLDYEPCSAETSMKSVERVASFIEAKRLRVHMTYKIGDAIFSGDALFIEDYGTGRCDFPKGSSCSRACRST